VTPPDNDDDHPEMVIVVAHRCAASMTILRTTAQSAKDDHPRPATPSRRSDGHPRPHTPYTNPMPINQPVYEPISQPARAQPFSSPSSNAARSVGLSLRISRSSACIIAVISFARLCPHGSISAITKSAV